MNMEIELVKYDWSKFNKMITLKYTPSKIERFFGSKVKIENYVGNCTVWHKQNGEMLTRCSTITESRLSDFYQSIELKNNL